MAEACCHGENPRHEIDQILVKYPAGDQASLIPVLQAVQGRYGYLPRPQLYAVSHYLKIPIGKIYGVATFYNQFRLQPVGKYLIQICTGTACHVKGANMIRQAIESELRIKAGETTPDGLFTFNTVACLGACSLAPVMTVGDEFHGRLTPQDVLGILREYQAKE